MSLSRVLALTAPAAFFVHAGVLTAIGAVSPLDTVWAALCVALAFAPSGWVAPGGWRRRMAEAALLPVAYALTMIDDPTMRRMALPPLLVFTAVAALFAALRRATPASRLWLVASFATAVRAAGGVGVTGDPWWEVALVFAGTAAVAWLATRHGGTDVGVLSSLIVGSVQVNSVVAIAASAAVVLGLVLARRVALLEFTAGKIARAWLPGAVAAAAVASALAPWPGLSFARAFPDTGWPTLAAGAVAAVVVPVAPPVLAGALWFGAACMVGPPRPPTPDHAGLVLTAQAPEALLPVSEGGIYALDVSLANAVAVPSGTPVAVVHDIGGEFVLRAGAHAAEWAHERSDVRPAVAHPLPEHPVWRPTGVGGSTVWGVAGRLEGNLVAGVHPRLVRSAELPPEVVVNVACAGSENPTAPRDWPLPAWLFGAALVVAVLQFASGTWRAARAVTPWVPLAAGALVARVPIEPLRLLGERFAPDLALLAVLAAWLAAARVWLPRRRYFLAASALLLPLALATPHLTPSLYGDEPFHLIVLDSLARDHDLDLSNNYDLEHHPYNRIYMTGKIFLHSPGLGLLLLPGYLVGARAGALAMLAFMGAGLAALLARRATTLRCPEKRVAVLVSLLVLTYPLATYSTQIWAEVPGALAAAACIALLAASRPHRVVLVGVAALSAAIKTRLAVITFPFLLVAWWRKKPGRRDLGRAALGFAVAAGLGLAAGWAFLGSPLGMRRLVDLVPTDLRQPVISVGGLLFDPAGGLLFTAPLLIVGVATVSKLWRAGGPGERAAVLGAAMTIVLLLHSREWYGGGAPPARYLVPLLPVFALSWAFVLRSPKHWRAAVVTLLPPSLLSWWVLVSRPHFSVNPGDGGWWFADALARRFVADARHLFPSFLRPSTATVLVPLLLTAMAVLVIVACRRRVWIGRTLARVVVPLWLLAGSGVVLALDLRQDKTVEIEDPQITHLGGALEPPPGTFSRYSVPNGWRVRDGEGIEAPLNLPAGARLSLEGWLEGSAQPGAAISASWDGAPEIGVAVSGERGTVALPSAPGAGRHRLRLTLRAPSGGAAVFDRIVVTR